MSVRQKKSVRVIVRLVLILFAAYTAVPLLMVLVTAVRPSGAVIGGPFTIPRELSLSNFRHAWIGGRFSQYVGNSFLITVPTVVIVLLLATPAGYSFAKIRYPGRDLLFFGILLGMMVPFQAVMIPLYFLINDLGLVNTRTAVVVVMAAGGLPFGIFMMRSFFVSLPNELIESARLDGATDIRVFYHVMLPLTFPAWVSLIIFQSMWAWNNFVVPLIFIYTQRLRPVTLGLMHFQGQYVTDYPLVAAAILITLSPLIILYVLLQKKFVSSITLGAVKS